MDRGTAMTLPAHGDMVANILTVYDRATNEQKVAGCRWYPAAGRIVTEIARETATDPAKIGYALAALSPRNPWLWNIADCYSYAVAARMGQPMPSATTFKRNQLRAWQALQLGTAPWVGAAPKVTAFVKAINGVRDAVVVDTWAYRVATGEAPATDGRRIGSFKAAAYNRIAAAYTEAAAARSIDARDIQAITWIVAQTEGLASNRRGRHDLTFKAGTPDFVKGLVA